MNNTFKKNLSSKNIKNLDYNSIPSDILKTLSKIKLVVSDLDGTFLLSNGELSTKNINIVKSLQKKNIKFTLASGRSDLMCASYIKDCNITLPIISSNGALIRSLNDNKIISKIIIDPYVAVTIMDFCKKHSLDYITYNTDELFFTNDSLRIEKFKAYNEIAKRNNTKPIKLNFYNNNHKIISQNGVLKILLFSQSKDNLNIAMNFLNSIPEISFVLSEKNALDISCFGTSKGEALKELCSSLNILPEETCVFGDYINDISMMKLAGISFSMADSPDSVKDIATFVTDSNDDSGVGNTLEYITSLF